MLNGVFCSARSRMAVGRGRAPPMAGGTSAICPSPYFSEPMKPPKCRVCLSEHFGAAHIWKGEALMPSELCRSASNSAINGPVVINKPAINTGIAINNAINRQRPVEACDGDSSVVGGRASVGDSQAVGRSAESKRGAKTSNRRTKEAYNAYMKGYMKKRRGLPS